MPLYRYIAKDASGKEVKGEMSGDSKQHVLTTLKMQKLYPVSLNEKKEKQGSGTDIKDLFKKKVKKKHIAIFSRQFASMLLAGVPLPTILDVLIKQERNPTFKGILEAINSDVLKGNTLSDSMAKHKVFPPLMISMVEVGEANGKLDVSFERVAINMEKEIKLLTKVKGAMIYPIVLLSVTILSSLVLTLVVIPKFTAMFEQMGVKLPATTLAFINISKFMTLYWYVVALTILIVVLVLIKMFKEPLMKEKIDKLKFRLPLFGRLQNSILMARFCRTFSALIDAGVGVVISLETVKNVINNLFIKNRFNDIIVDVQSGLTISEAMSKHTVFTPLVISMTKIGEESGRLGEILNRTAEIYEDASESQLQGLTAMMEPAITVIMAFVIGFIVMSIIQPLFQMYGSLGM